jgi:hypothetical protein
MLLGENCKEINFIICSVGEHLTGSYVKDDKVKRRAVHMGR